MLGLLQFGDLTEGEGLLDVTKIKSMIYEIDQSCVYKKAKP